MPSSGTEIRVIGAQDLTDEHRCDWDCIRASRDGYRSSFFAHQFVSSVSCILANVELLVVSRHGKSVGFLPIQRHAAGKARPAAVGINDAHGFLSAPNTSLDVAEILSAAQLSRYLFHASPVDAPGVSQFESGRTKAFLAELHDDPLGYEQFLKRRSSTIARQGQKTRKLARDVGPLRFELDCRDPAMFARLIQLKRAQYQRTHTFDIFSMPWIPKLLNHMMFKHVGGPRGILSVLYAGSTPVALHYGMLENSILHYWFPVFDANFSYGSPGTELFLRVARAAAERGIRSIDMGYGEQAYKTKLTNVQTEMSFGVMDPNPLRRAWYRGQVALHAKLKQSKLREALKPWARKMLPGFGQNGYRS